MFFGGLSFSLLPCSSARRDRSRAGTRAGLILLLLLVFSIQGIHAQEESFWSRAIPLGPGETLTIKSLEEGGSLQMAGDVAYATGRTRIERGDLRLEADSIRLDQRRLVAEAEGNIILSSAEGEIRAESLYYDFRQHTGRAYKAQGQYGPVFFRYRKGEKEDQPTFQMVSEDEVLIHGASITTCDLAVPHFRISAQEIMIYPDDRVFIRGAVLYLWEVPVFYMPAYTKSLREPSPWFLWLGYHSELGAWARLGYTYKHESLVPSFADEDVLRAESRGQLTVFATEFLERGPGGGLEYRYELGYERHRGEIDLFVFEDGERNVRSESSYARFWEKRAADGTLVERVDSREIQYSPEEEIERYRIGVRHRSILTPHARWYLNTDYFSDPDIYDEVLDLFGDLERRRVMERDARTALIWTRAEMTARLVVELKDRIGRDRITNFSNPGDILGDFDEQAELPITKRSDEGIRTKRWGRVSLKAPQATIATTWMKLWNLPLYYHTDLNLFRNLDRGLNTVSEDDDAYVRGADWYNALMWRVLLGRQVTWINQIGGGAGVADRESMEFGYLDEDDFASPAGEDVRLVPNNSMGGLVFEDPETFLIGTKRFNLDDVQDSFVYGDFLSRLHARLTDTLSGDVTYRYRATTEHFLGDWYSEMGNRYVRDDLYDFRLRENNINARLRYALARPRFTATLRYFSNFIEEDELHPQEVRNLYGADARWANLENTVSLGARVSLSDQQMYHPSAMESFLDSSLRYGGYVGYTPPSRLWWTNLSVDFEEELDRPIGDRSFNRYTERENPYTVGGGIGGRIGPKYMGQISGTYRSEYGTLQRLSLSLRRDMHDLWLMIAITFKQDPYNNEYLSNEKRDVFSFMDEMDLRFALIPKLPGDNVVAGVPGLTVLQSQTAPEGEEASAFQVQGLGP
ncbi:LPS-assembly protein LptD [bacterium]|nr:LPS-assembly protein LptD [bacterium]